MRKYGRLFNKDTSLCYLYISYYEQITIEQYSWESKLNLDFSESEEMTGSQIILPHGDILQQ